MADISLLFDVAMGGGNPSGDSEQLIRSQLEAIVNGINSKPFSIKFQADEQSLQQFQKRVSEIAVSLGSGVGTSSAAFEQVTRQINIAATAIHTMNGAVNATNLEKISTALSGMAGAEISAGAISDIITRLESMSVVITDAKIQFEDLGKTGERVPRLIIEGVDAAGNAIRRNLRFDNKGELERDLTDITVKLAEVEKASKSSGASTNSSGEKATDAFTKAKKAVTDYYSALTQLERSGLQNVITQGADGTWSSGQTGCEARVAQLNRLTQEYHNATAARKTFTASQQVEFTEHETARAQQYRVAVEDVTRAERQRQETLRSTVTITRSYDNTIADCQKKLKDWSAAENSRHQSSREAYDALRNETTAAEQARIQYNNGEISLEKYTEAMDRLKSTLISTKATLQQNGDAAKTLGERLAGLAKKFTQWLGVSQIIMYIYRSIRKMVTAVIELDTAMTELKKVTNETDATYDRFLENAATRAKKLGASLTDVVNTSADFARLGLSLEDAEVVSDAALVYKNVGDGIEDIDQASESLISTMQAFGIEAKDVMTIVDKFNVAGNNFAISSGGVGDALLNSASALAAANNTLDESIALITAANETIQNPEKVGTALKTLSMYIRAAKTEAEEAGISTEGMANSVSELREEILTLTGNRVDIMIDDDSFKSTYQIIKELSEVWDSLSETTQSNITELIGGGVRNANVINALMTNMATASEVIEKTSKSTGSALAENEKVLESIQGKINVFKATFQEFAQNLISSEFVRQIVDFGTFLLNLLNGIAEIVDALGGLNTVLAVSCGLFATLKAEMIGTAIINGITKFGFALENIGAKMTLVGRAIKVFIAMNKAARSTQAGAMVVYGQSNTLLGRLAAAFQAVGLSASAAQIAVGAFMAVLAVGAVIISQFQQAQERANAQLEEERAKAIAAADEAAQLSDELVELTNKYIDLSAAVEADDAVKEQLIQTQNELIDRLHLEGVAVDELIDKYGSLTDAILNKALAELENNETNLRAGLRASEGEMLSAPDTELKEKYKYTWAPIKSKGIVYYSGGSLFPSDEDYARMYADEQKLTDAYNALRDAGYLGPDAKAIRVAGTNRYSEVRLDLDLDLYTKEGILSAYKKLQEMLAVVREAAGSDNEVYKDLEADYMAIASAVEAYYEDVDGLNQHLAQQYILQGLLGREIPTTRQEFDEYKKSVVDAAVASGEFDATTEEITNLIDSTLKSQSRFAPFYVDELKDKLYGLTDVLSDDTKKAIDATQSRIKTLSDALEKLSEGSLEATAVTDLLQEFPELAPYVDMAAENFGNLDDGLRALIQNAPDSVIETLKELADTNELTDEAKDLIEDLCAALEALAKVDASSTLSQFEQFVKTLSDTDALDAGFSQLSTIFNDIKDGGDFDWGSILSDDFKQAFGDLGDSYEKFMRTVASSPRNLAACRSAFNELATAYIANSGALDNVTESNRDAVVAMLEQMGVTNAVALVDAQLELNKTRLAYATGEYVDMTYQEIEVLYKEAAAGSIAKQALAELAVQKYLASNTVIESEKDIEHLLALATAANATEASLARVNEAKAIMAQADIIYEKWNSEYRGGNPRSYKSFQEYTALVDKAQEILSTPLQYELPDAKDIIVNFEGVSQSAKNAKDDVEKLYDAAKSGIEELIDYRRDMLKQDIENEKDALNEKLDALKEFYDKQKEMLQDQRDEEKYLDDQAEKRKAVTDIQSELAMLANDDSAWAQKRKLELREELSDAEKELSEFEKDHALDITLDMLDEQQEAQEKQLQEQIDALDERLNDPHALYNQALADIKNNTYSLYQEMISYNRKYGSGNDDDVSEMWNDAYEANKDYKNKTGAEYKGIHLGNYSASDASVIGKVSAVSATLKQGSSGNGVKALQHALNQLGFGNSGTKSLDGSFGKNTKSAVIAFQRAHGLSPDGSVGPATKAKFKALGYAMGTASATQGIHRVDELGTEYVFESPSDGTRYRMFQGGEKVLTAKATDFLYRFANSDGGILTNLISDILDRVNLGSVSRFAQVIEVNTGDVIVQGNANMQTVSAIRREQRKNVDYILREFNRLSK